MEPTSSEIRYVLLNRFKNGDNATQAHKYLCFSYDSSVLSERQCQRWFQKFKNGHFEVNDSPGRGRKLTLDIELLGQKISENPRQTTRELATILNCAQQTIVNGLKRLGLTCKRGTWVPHELTSSNKELRVSICRSLLERQKIDPFLERVITCDEKWVLYDNVHCHKQWLPKGQLPVPTAQPGLHPKKVLISVFWDYKGIVHFELLPEGQAINAEVYCQQLDRLNEKLSTERPSLVNRKGVIFHQDNARPHTASLTSNKIKNDLKWELLPHPPYSPDLAPSDYHLFRSLEHFLRNKKFENRSALYNGLKTFFDSKSPIFFRRGIFNIINRWQRVIDSDGEYCI
ncbi:histone-lysine N-methyltransferase SETMAR-like [Panonychus citri]|uniref:histone-lysine N-methyltransferase SETMAR-like n=1 Tax=Panonychus citri TaxID=50023 RepID=UPI0023073EDE|nr:histone-lysine N-methyltransferase SETMAR-like [Panonychus citri]